MPLVTAGGASTSGHRIHVLCTTCGKPWPATLPRCPDDGTELVHRPTPPAVHLRATMLFPVQLGVPEEPASPKQSEPTTIDGIAFEPWSDDTQPPIEDLRVSELFPLASDLDGAPATDVHAVVVSPEPSPLASDLSPAAPAAKVHAGAASARPVPRQAPVAAEPPTGFVRRYGSHIELPPGSVVGEDYEIEATLGAGAMGEVYAARHLRLGKRVAIKVISPRLSRDPEAVGRFSREARALARVHHPGIVAIEHIGELTDGRAFFVMECLLGEPLDARLERGPLPYDEALDVLDQIARALEAAHLQGVTHRDLKPANIFLVRLPNEARPIVKLLDFGLAKLAAGAGRLGEGTLNGVAIGTPMYMSPEQSRGPDVDGRTDVYALGCLAYELLLGAVPFPDAATVAALVAAHLREAPPLPRALWPEIPPALDMLLFGLLAKDPAHRPTLAQVRHVIASERAGTYGAGPRSASASFVDAAPSPRPRMPARSTLAIAGLALLGGMAIGATALGHCSRAVAPARVDRVAPGESGHR